MKLNKEQEKISYIKPSGYSLVKGIAGSGKTTVGIYRIPFLLNNYCTDDEDNILLVTYNKTLVNYMNYIYDKIEKEYNERYPTLFKIPKTKVKITTVDSLIYLYYLKALKREKKEVLKNIGNYDKINIVQEYSTKLYKEYSDIGILNDENKKVLLDEIEWIKACNYCESEYQVADRLGAGKHEEHLKRVPKNSNIRKALYSLMESYSEEVKRRGLIDFNDIRKIALEEVRSNIANRYTHIVIDESQDLSKLQLEFIKELYNGEKPHSSFMFLFDSSQSIYSQSWLGNGRNFTSIGINMVGKSKSLSKNFRTTTQISQAAYSLLVASEEATKDENYVKPYLIDRQGEYPIYKHLSNEQGELREIVSIIEKECSGYMRKDIIIVARLKTQLLSIKSYLDLNGIQSDLIDRDTLDFEKESIKLMTMHSVKGMESKVVILSGLNDKVLPYYSSNDDVSKELEELMEKKLLYVGMTRATEYLYMISNSTPSKFIEDIDKNYLKVKKGMEIKPLRNISIDDYLYKDKLVNQYNSEEKVRQWMLKELIDTYGYLEDMLEIEYPVTIGSKKYYVDIAIFTYIGGERRPFIFVETKAQDIDTNEALNQLKSYMEVSKGVDIGITTNGRDLEIFSKSEENICDIPEFHLDMKKGDVTGNKYLDLKKDRELYITEDIDSGIMEVDYGVDTEIYLKEDQTKIPIYGKISAGIPIFMNPDIDEYLYIPGELIKGEEVFALKVKGDSMINANIHEGDCVILRQDILPNSGDIVAAAIDEEATLKRLMKMRNSIILLPENPDYEEIYINEQDANLLGVAVGVVKRSK